LFEIFSVCQFMLHAACVLMIATGTFWRKNSTKWQLYGLQKAMMEFTVNSIFTGPCCHFGELHDAVFKLSQRVDNRVRRARKVLLQDQAPLWLRTAMGFQPVSSKVHQDLRDFPELLEKRHVVVLLLFISQLLFNCRETRCPCSQLIL